ncbi:MAG: 50S ribosomal protein L10 [Chlamydiales bacterium]|nr:50S ribosomal protein L10 [Chlamydiales bacterium]MCH9635302.1 50S ribosomal protein L10 [Chlamydiales bacterium]
MRAEKQFLLDEIKEKIEKSNGFVVARYQKFTPGQSRDFRNELAELGGEFEVVKKRVLIKAASTLGIEFDNGNFEGHVGVLFAHEDPLSVAKKAVKYGEQNDDAISVLAGHMEGQVMSADEVVAVAKLPSKDELRAQIVGLFEAPMSQTVGALNAVLTSVLHCLEAKSGKE